MKEKILQIQNLTFAYSKDKKALNQITLEILKGEKIAVLGPNGAGKSTFFLALNGVLKPQEGEILYQGNKITKKNLNEIRKNVGIVFQDADQQMIASTVQAEISFGPMNLKLPKEEVVKRVDEALTYMDISHLKDRPPHYLSGGEKKRVSIADIIAMQSEVILFDEPTAALDPVSADMLEEVLHKLGEEEKTILISTHDVDFAYRWADRILVFWEGSIIADGEPSFIFQNEDIIRRAHLKRPMLLELYEVLVEKKILYAKMHKPKTVCELKERLEIESSAKCELTNV